MRFGNSATLGVNRVGSRLVPITPAGSVCLFRLGVRSLLFHNDFTKKCNTDFYLLMSEIVLH